MSYTVCPYLLNISDLEKIVGSKDRDLMIKVLQNKAQEDDGEFDESELDAVEEDVDEEEEDEEDWNTVAAVKAIINGDLNNDRIRGFQYGYGLEAICLCLGEREFVEQLESVHGSWTFEEMWPWILDSKSPVPLSEQGEDFPYIGHLRLADIQMELDRTQALNFDDCDDEEEEMYTEIREGLVELYEKALEKKTDIVTFYC